jgi:hypothetical protein
MTILYGEVAITLVARGGKLDENTVAGVSGFTVASEALAIAHDAATLFVRVDPEQHGWDHDARRTSWRPTS